MIQLNISTTSKESIEEIGEFLVKKNLAIDIQITSGVKNITIEKEKIVTKEIHHLKAKTKALLFTTINNLLHKKYPEDAPEVYSIPITHMDWQHAEQLSEKVIKA